MKKLLLAFVALFVMTVSATAMSYDQAKDQALFLTDKMAYELNLTDDQYEAAYEINLDYLMNINDNSDLYGNYWNQRNYDLEYILQDWQYRSYLDCLYFYRPLYWGSGYWHFRIYSRYPRRGYLYFGRPAFHGSYRGGHSWRTNGGRSWYNGRSYGPSRNNNAYGMKDRYNRGEFGNGRTFGNGRNTRVSQNNRTFGTRNSTSQNTRSSQNANTQSRNRTIGNSRTNTTSTRSSGSTFGTRQSSTRETVRRTQGTSSRSNVTTRVPSNTFSSRSSSVSRSSSSSRSNGNSSSSRSSSRSNSGSSRSSSNGGSHFGNR